MSQSHSESAGDAASLIEIDPDLLAKYLTCQIDEIRKLNRRLETTNQELRAENAYLKARQGTRRTPVQTVASFLRRFPRLHRAARGVYVRLRGVAGKVRRRLSPAGAA
jgi:hypothetical protein